MKPLVRSFALFCLVILLLLGLWFRPLQASSLTDSRINQLEFQMRQLQTQLNQISNQNNSSPTPSMAQRTVNIDPTADPTAGELTFDEQFDNLATLVIEINQRLRVIEETLAEGARN